MSNFILGSAAVIIIALGCAFFIWADAMSKQNIHDFYFPEDNVFEDVDNQVEVDNPREE